MTKNGDSKMNEITTFTYRISIRGLRREYFAMHGEELRTRHTDRAMKIAKTVQHMLETKSPKGFDAVDMATSYSRGFAHSTKDQT